MLTTTTLTGILETMLDSTDDATYDVLLHAESAKVEAGTGTHML